MAENSALGAAIAAGSASGVNVWPLASLPLPSDNFNPTTNPDGIFFHYCFILCDALEIHKYFSVERDIMYNRWKMAIEKCHGWASSALPKYQMENKCGQYFFTLFFSLQSILLNLICIWFSDMNENRLYASIPSGLFILSSYLLLILADKLNF